MSAIDSVPFELGSIEGRRLRRDKPGWRPPLRGSGTHAWLDCMWGIIDALPAYAPSHRDARSKDRTSVAGASPHDVFAKGGVARLPILALKGKVHCFPSLHRLDGSVMLMGRLDVSVIRSPRIPFEPPGQGGRREEGDQEEGNKTSAHCGSPCCAPVLIATPQPLSIKADQFTGHLTLYISGTPFPIAG